MSTPVVEIGSRPLTREQIIAVARDNAQVHLSEAALRALGMGRMQLEALAATGLPAYGLTTGVGALMSERVDRHQMAEIQQALVDSHAAGIGAAVEAETVRAMAVLRLRTLATGRTGVRPVVARALAGLLNSGLVPIVNEYGSLGCSGDLAPLAAVAAALTGRGRVLVQREPRLAPAALAGREGPDASAAMAGCVQPADQALREAGLTPVRLAHKEALALMNGTEGMLGMLVLSTADLQALLDVADLTAALSLQALRGTDRPFAAELQELRPHPGQSRAAAHLRDLLAGSELLRVHNDGSQDPYCLRCVPQVHGAARDALAYASGVADRELASCIDNPVLLPEGRLESNGNFHGAPLAHAMDFLAIVVADLAVMAERRTDRMLDRTRSQGLPPFLAFRPGVDSGYMIAHYTQVSLVADLKRLAVPASVDSTPTSAGQEDHVSLGWSAGRKLRRSLELLRAVLGIEFLTAARAVDLRAPDRPAPACQDAIDLLRTAVPGPGPDRHLAPDIAAATELITSPALLDIVNRPVANLLEERSTHV
ncbi:histidine ammonia-lyase [Actinomadura sp. 6N118]|uniref:histidine ammonia-lyase n=1 Tax=Actinomadura sp. 6N118 TaxID=3375151 RepID=UPI0037910DB5